MKCLFPFLAALVTIGTATTPREALPLDAAEWPADYRLHLDGAAKVRLGDSLSLALEKTNAPHDIAIEHPANSSPVLRVWSAGKLIRGPEEIVSLSQKATGSFPDAKVDLGKDFTAVASFESKADGTLFAKCAKKGKWSPDAKALFIRDGHLVYDIGWLGEMSGGPKVDDGKPHTAVLTVS